MTKSFKDRIEQKAVNPALQFITQEPIASREPEQQAHQARRAQPQYDEETKSRRLQLLITPSLYEAVKAQATKEKVSVNEMINSILKDALRK